MVKKVIVGFGLVLLLVGCTQLGPSKPKDYSLELTAAEQLYRGGNTEEAKKAYAKIYEKDHRVVQASYRLGTIAFKQGNYEEAQKFFAQAVNVEPRFEKAQYNLAVTHLILAENHFKYFVATASENTDIDKVGQLLQAIDKFGGEKPMQGSRGTSSLERISSELQQGLNEP